MLLNDVRPLFTAVQFQLFLYDGCHPVYIKEKRKDIFIDNKITSALMTIFHQDTDHIEH